MNKTYLEKLKEIEHQIVEVGATAEQLKDFRKQLYRFDNYYLSNEAWNIKQNLLSRIKELLEDEGKSKVVFYEIYQEKSDNQTNNFICFIENKKVAKAICKCHPGLFYIKNEVVLD